MPLRGGASDKAGNSFERRWTTFALVDLLAGTGESVRIEVPGDEGVGAEFRVTRNGEVEWHQAKRQRDAGPWTIHNMRMEDVLQPWWPKLQAGSRCVFVSSTGAQELLELTQRARSATSWPEFNAEFLRGEQAHRFERLHKAWPTASEPEVFDALQRVDVRLIGETDLARWIDDRLAALVKGEPKTAAAVIAQFVDDSTHLEITATDVWTCLAGHGISPLALAEDARTVARVAQTLDLFVGRLKPLHIQGQEIERPQMVDGSAELDKSRRVLLAGGAGSGKSVIAARIAQEARKAGWEVLVLSADRLPDVPTVKQLGLALDLPDSPPIVLRAVAADGPALLVIDQLDAVSIVSGRHPERLRLIADLLTQAESYPNVRVLMACRQFDVDNDRELRAMASTVGTTTLPIHGLHEAVVLDVLHSLGFASSPERLVQLLTVPLHLAIFCEIAPRSGAAEIRTQNDLFDRYWEVKRRSCREKRGGQDEWLQVIDLLISSLSERQALTASFAILDEFDEQAKTMASEGVLVIDGAQVAFFHETFFDYCFARRFVASGQDFRSLLMSTEQDLFRRAQVRQILAYERSNDREKYLADLSWVLFEPKVRMHIKALAVATLGTIPNPSQAEWDILKSVSSDPTSALHEAAWQTLRQNPGWFQIIDEASEWQNWLSGEDRFVSLATWVLAGMAAAYPDEVARLVRGTYAGGEAPPWLPAFLRGTDVYKGRALYQLMVEAVSSGSFDDDGAGVWHITYEIGVHHPDWASELIAKFVDRRVTIACQHDSQAAEGLGRPFEDDPSSLSGSAIEQVVAASPDAYVRCLLPEFLKIMDLYSRPDWGEGEPVPDAVWSTRFYGTDLNDRDALFAGFENALKKVASTDPTLASEIISKLRKSGRESAWFLAAQGYLGNPTTFADEVADWLANERGALRLGYADTPHWTSRELITAVSGVCSEPAFERLVDALVGYTTPYERTYRGIRQRGWGELCLLNGLDGTRTPLKARRRLEELRRKFRCEDVDPPAGISGGVVPPPIPLPKARRMSDEQWLRAIARHGLSHTRFDRDGELVGDALTQAQVLESVTKEEPVRFAHLLFRLPPETAEPYVTALLRGLAGARLGPALLLKVCTFAQELGGSDTNRFVAWLIESHSAGPLSPALLQILEMVAVHDPDPEADNWRTERQGSAPLYGGSIDAAGLNSTRGAGVHAIGKVISEEPARLETLRDALVSAVDDPTLQVRAMAVAALIYILNVDAGLAVNLFRNAVGGDDAVLESRHVENFLNYAIRMGHYENLRVVLDRMLSSSRAPVRVSGARQLAVSSFLDPGLDDAVDSVMMEGEDIRSGIVEIFSRNVRNPVRSERAIEVVAAAFHDDSAKVRSSATRVFSMLSGVAFDSYETVFTSFAKSRAMGRHAESLFHLLEDARSQLPIFTLDVCEEYVRQNADELGQIASGAALASRQVSRLVLRVHAQSTQPAVRSRCLDLIDALVAARAYRVQEDLDSVER